MPPETTTELTFHDITSDADLQLGTEIPMSYLVLGISLLVILLCLVALFILKRKTKETQPPPVSPIETALKQLKELKTQTSLPVPESASKLSTLTRTALTALTNTPVAYQSQQEFRQLADLHLPNPSLQSDFSKLLHSLWMLEYRQPQLQSTVMEEHYQTAESLLSQLSAHRS